MDKFVSDQYNNQLPKLDKKKKADIMITSELTSPTNSISTTVQKTSKLLPLIVYWQYDYRHTCRLNPAIAVTNFSNTLNALSTKTLAQKLNGQRLELTVEQIPTSFSLVDKAHVIWVIYAYSWDRIYMEPDFKDLVVSYKLIQSDNTVKTGKISIRNNEQNKNLRFFQSWKSATSEYISNYNTNIATMTKAFINQLVEEI
jgi:hypothetical protein